MSRAAASAVTLVPANSLHVSKPTWWLESRFHFNFADFWSGKEQFGPLRVLNDDLVKPKAGFGRHPHRNAEIFSYVVRGELSHQDSMGNKESLGRGCVQYLSAGTGVTHSEMNDGDKTCRFLQTWFMPDQTGYKPQYGQRIYTDEDRHNVLLQMLNGNGAADKQPKVEQWPTMKNDKVAATLNQDANIFVSECDAGVKQSVVLQPGRQIYLVCIEGSLTIGEPAGEVVLKERDAAEIVASKNALHLEITAAAADEENKVKGGAHFMLMEMTSNPKTGGW